MKHVNIPILIPAYNPDEKLPKLVRALLQSGVRNIIVVDDGSELRSKAIFDKLRGMRKCTVISHAVNLGKGRAIKTGINHCLLHFPELQGVVTADADGQHLPADIIRVMEALKNNTKSLVLGCRDFRGSVPLRSLIGNRITGWVFALLVGRRISDTQTGLRGLPARFLQRCVRLNGERYEYEMNMLISTKTDNVALNEVPIDTVYIAENRSSHFNPILDSFRIYFLILRFAFSSTLTSVLDFSVFAIAYYSGQSILASILIARIVAGTFNFVINKRIVFQDRGSTALELGKFATLVATLGGLTYLFISILVREFGWNVIVTKAVVDTAVFIVSFAIQREFVFTSPVETTNEER